MRPQRMSHQLRKGKSPELIGRRWVPRLLMIGAAAETIGWLYQTGILRDLSGPPLKIFNSDCAYCQWATLRFAGRGPLAAPEAASATRSRPPARPQKPNLE